MRSLVLTLLFGLYAYSNEVNLNKDFTPQATKINSIVKFQGNYYASNDFTIFEIGDINSNWEVFHQVDIGDGALNNSIENLFIIGNQDISLLSYLDSDGNVYYNFTGLFEKTILPPEFENLRVEKMENTKSGRTFALAMDTTDFDYYLFEIRFENLEVIIVPFSNQTYIEDFAEDEQGRIWVVGDEIEIFDGQDYSTVTFDGFIWSDIAVMNNKIYNFDSDEISYFDYLNDEEVYLEIPELEWVFLDDDEIGFEIISDNELLFYSGDSDTGVGLLIKINSETDEYEILRNEFNSFTTFLQDQDNGNYLIGTSKNILYTNDLENFETSQNGLSGILTFLNYNSPNYFIGYGFDSYYAYNKNESREISLGLDFDPDSDILPFRIVIGESNLNIIAINPDLIFSEDGGETWENSNLILTDVEDSPLLFNTEHYANEVFYSAKNKIYSSIDDGKTWDLVSEPNIGPENGIKNFSISNSGEFIISTENGIYDSNGETLGLNGFEVFDAKKINYLGAEYLIAVYEGEESFYVYRENLTTNAEENIQLDFDIWDPFDDLGLFFTIMSDGNVLLADLENSKNYALFINQNELEEFQVEGDLLFAFSESNLGLHSANSVLGSVYNIETTLSVDGKYEIKIDKVYPNPANNYIKLKDIQNNTLVEITDNLGNTFESRYNSGIDISKVNPGMYFVKYQNMDGEILTSKFIKE